MFPFDFGFTRAVFTQFCSFTRFIRLSFYYGIKAEFVGVLFPSNSWPANEERSLQA